MTSRLVVLVPPSQGKAPGGRRGLGGGRFDESLAGARRHVNDALVDALTTLDDAHAARLFGATGPLLERARAAFARENEVTTLLPAWRRYQGVVWTHLDPTSISPSQRGRVFVPSGRYGLVTANDPIGDYRLRMNASIPGIGPLARYWRPLITPLLVEATKGYTVLNLLPGEHEASVNLAELRASRRVLDVRFVAHDESRAVGHDAKAIKGVLARRALTGGLDEMVAEPWHDWTVERRDDSIIVTQPATRASTW